MPSSMETSYYFPIVELKYFLHTRMHLMQAWGYIALPLMLKFAFFESGIGAKFPYTISQEDFS